MEPRKIGIKEALMTDGLFRNSYVPMPQELVKKLFKLVVYIGLGTVFMDVIAFTLQLSKDAITNGYVLVAVLCVALYSLNNTISNKYWIKTSNKKDLFYEDMYKIIRGNAVQVFMNVRGHIYKNVNGKNEHMSSNEIMNTYISAVEKIWQLKTFLFEDVTKFVSLFISLIGFLLVTSVEIENIALFFLIITALSIVTIYFSQKKVKANTAYAKPFKDARDKRDDAKNDILNIEALNDDHVEFMYQNFEKASVETFDCGRKCRLETDKNEERKSDWQAIAVLLIVAIKICETGLDNIQVSTILSIVAILGIYAQLMSKITRIINVTERYQREIEELWVYKDDFFDIMRCNMSQLAMKAQPAAVIDSLVVPAGEIKYKYQVEGTPFKVKVCNDIMLNIGDIVLFTGPTGCGKSTILKAIVGNAIFDNYALNYNFITEGKVKALMQQADARLGCNDVLSELTFGKEFDREKLLWILKGLNLYDEIAEKNSDVLWYLANSKADSFSNGQKQRLLIARILFNLRDDIQIVAFDEATNALNDEITDKVLNFIVKFCENRLLLFVTHQVDIYARYATKHFKYVPGIQENSYQVNF